MPVIPNVDEFTVCEIHRDFLTSSGETDTAAEDAYSKILGRCYPRIPFNPSIKCYKICEPEAAVDEANESTRLNDNRGGVLLAVMQLPFFKQIYSRFTVQQDFDVRRKVDLFQGVSWHKQKQCLAFISGPHQVCVFDFEESEPRDPIILSSECQREVYAIAWRPNAGVTLCVACWYGNCFLPSQSIEHTGGRVMVSLNSRGEPFCPSHKLSFQLLLPGFSSCNAHYTLCSAKTCCGGVCIWMASYPGTIAPVRSGIASFLGPPSGSSGARWVLVDFLQNSNAPPVTSLAWNPSGRLLASASCYDSAFRIWDVAQGVSTPLRRGFGGVCLLQWSPKGDYLFTSHMDGVFRLWETESWTSEKWSSSGGPVVSAMWSSNDAVLLMAFDKTTTLGALHFASKPPALDVQLLPVELSDIEAITGGRGLVEKMAWDYSGERLAISFSGGDEMNSGLLAVYDTRKTPILTVSLMGFIRGPEAGTKALAFAFYDSLEQGLLLSVCWSSGVCCTYPLLFKSGSKQTLH